MWLGKQAFLFQLEWPDGKFSFTQLNQCQCNLRQQPCKFYSEFSTYNTTNHQQKQEILNPTKDYRETPKWWTETCGPVQIQISSVQKKEHYARFFPLYLYVPQNLDSFNVRFVIFLLITNRGLSMQTSWVRKRQRCMEHSRHGSPFISFGNSYQQNLSISVPYTPTKIINPFKLYMLERTNQSAQNFIGVSKMRFIANKSNKIQEIKLHHLKNFSLNGTVMNQKRVPSSDLINSAFQTPGRTVIWKDFLGVLSQSKTYWILQSSINIELLKIVFLIFFLSTPSD